MVRIRFRRTGARGQPSYRLVAADKEAPRDGRFIEILGFYNPRTEPATIQLKEDRIFDWIQKGAQLSDSAEKVMRSAGALDRYERYKQGEDIETLLEESKAAEAARNINPKTTQVTQGSDKSKQSEEDQPIVEQPEPEIED
jgi:small subunit ribosomal protein S16